MLYICFGFDYELFLGENYGSYDDILFEPTKKIANIFADNNVSATFFADVLSSIQLKNFEETKPYSEMFEKQIKQLIRQKMDVQLHIHSNWLKSTVVNGKLLVSSKNYKIHDFDFSDNGTAKEIINLSIKYLNELCKSESNSYKCVAYRAGGFMIQPETELFRVLLDSGITIDSSIAPFMKNGKKKTGYYYNFTKCPRDYADWYISPIKGFRYKSKSKNNCLLEIPILTYNSNLLTFLFSKKDDIRLKPIKPRGSYVDLNNRTKSKISLFLKRLFDRRLVSLDTDKAKFVFDKILSFYRKSCSKKNDIFVSIIGHPKLICNEERLMNIDLLLKLITNCDKKIKIISFQEAERIIDSK